MFPLVLLVLLVLFQTYPIQLRILPAAKAATVWSCHTMEVVVRLLAIVAATVEVFVPRSESRSTFYLLGVT